MEQIICQYPDCSAPLLLQFKLSFSLVFCCRLSKGYSQLVIGDFGKRHIDVLREMLRLPTFRSKLAIVPIDPFGNENIRIAQPNVLSSSDQLSNLHILLDEDSGSEYRDVVVLTKRKRRTNNSFALDLDDDSLEIAKPLPPKRLQFSSNRKESLVLIGV